MAGSGILLAHDFSERSSWAARRAFQLAGQKQWPVHAAHVVDEAFPENKWLSEDELNAEGSIVEALKQAVVKRLEGDMADLASEAGVALECHASFGYVAEQLHALSEQHDAGLLVVGAHGRHALRDLFLGATAEQLLWYVNIPTLVVRSDNYSPYQSILVAVDFSEEAEAAMGLAQSWFPEAQVKVVHVVDNRPLERLHDAGLSWAATEEEQSRQDTAAQSRIQEMMTRRNMDPDKVESLILHGHPVKEIGALAEELQADLVVMAGRSHNRLTQWMPGRVASRLIHQLPCDVMLARGS